MKIMTRKQNNFNPDIFEVFGNGWTLFKVCTNYYFDFPDPFLGWSLYKIKARTLPALLKKIAREAKRIKKGESK